MKAFIADRQPHERRNRLVETVGQNPRQAKASLGFLTCALEGDINR